MDGRSDSDIPAFSSTPQYVTAELNIHEDSFSTKIVT
jgi:hypothetical protein